MEDKQTEVDDLRLQIEQYSTPMRAMEYATQQTML